MSNRCPQVDDLARRNPKTKKIWVNPSIPAKVNGINVRGRVRTYEKTYWASRDRGESDKVARKKAIEAQYRGLSRTQVLKTGAVLDMVSDPAHEDRGKFRSQQSRPKRRQPRSFDDMIRKGRDMIFG